MPRRRLLITADDFGIGPETSRGILELGEKQAITSTVLLVNSPYAEDSIQQWKRTGSTLEVGWHPCLTLDRPVLPASQVPSLTDHDGEFWRLGTFISRLMRGLLVEAEIDTELSAQYHRFIDLLGYAPPIINGHHHVHVFSLVQHALFKLLRQQRPKPYIRRVCETWHTLYHVPGARFKRFYLNQLGQAARRTQVAAGYPGADCLIGISNPGHVKSPHCFTRWIQASPGELVELMCHPGFEDATLPGRGESSTARVLELQQLLSPDFKEALALRGFQLSRVADLISEYR